MRYTQGVAALAFVAADEFLEPESLIEAVQFITFDFRRQLERMILHTT